MRYRARMAFAIAVFLGIGISHLPALHYDLDGTVQALQLTDSRYYGYEGSFNTMSIKGDIAVGNDLVISNTGQVSLGTFEVTIDADSFIRTDTWANYGHVLFFTDECCQTVINVKNDLVFNAYNDDSYTMSLAVTFSGQGQVLFKIGNEKQVGFEALHVFDNNLPAPYNWLNTYENWDATDDEGVKVSIIMDQTFIQAIEDGQNKVVFQRYAYDYDDMAQEPMLTGTGGTTKVTIGRNSFITYLSPIETGLLDCEDSSAAGYGTLAFDPSCNGPGRMVLRIKGSGYVDQTEGTRVGNFSEYRDGALVVAGHYIEDIETLEGIRDTNYTLTKPAGVEAIFRIIDELAWAEGGGGLYQSSGELELDLTTSEPKHGSGNLISKPSRRGLLVVNECTSIPSLADDPYISNRWANGHTYEVEGKGASTIRPGFLIGVNGMMEVFHNTFLDYIATATQGINPYEAAYSVTLIHPEILKVRNPSALFIDGLSHYDITNWDPADLTNFEDSLHYPFAAHLPENGGRHAQILLRGDARLYLRAGVRNDGIVSGVDWYVTPSSLGGYIVNNFDRVYSFTINNDANEGTYDGSFIAGDAEDERLLNITYREGLIALDVEGKLSIRSTDDNNTTNDAGFIIYKKNEAADPTAGECALSRHVVTEASARGALNVPPIKLDFMGQESKDDMFTRVTRPLGPGVFFCYNASSIFLNAEMALHNIHWHHNDLLKIATPEPDKGEPSLVGGEKPTFDDYFWNLSLNDDNDYTDTAKLFLENPIEEINSKVPLVSLYTSTLFLHESFGASGVRFVVTDKFLYDPDDALGHAKLVPNVSHIICYNHGDSLDMLKRGYGRTLLLGSQQNKFGYFLDDCEIECLAQDRILYGHSEFSQNAFMNIYRTWNTDGNDPLWGDEGYLVQLSLETDAQPRYTIQYETRDTHNNPGSITAFSKLIEWQVDRQKRVATQVFYLGNDSFASVGWTTTNADQLITRADMRARDFATDGTYSYSYGINEGLRPRPWDAQWVGSRLDVDDDPMPLDDFKFSLSSEANNRAELYVNGDCYYFGGRDTTGNKATEPVVGANESCIIYTNHGGKTHINQETISIDQERYYDCFIDTIFAYKPWPRIRIDSTDATSNFIDGLSGIVELPHDQAKSNRSIQPYNINFQTMLTADEQLKENNLRLSVYDEQTYGTSPMNRRKASGEIVSIAWNFRHDKSTRIDVTEVDPAYEPMKSFGGFKSPFGFGPSRSTMLAGDTRIGPATMPEALLTVSTGDFITQMKVSGATKADPFHLYISGGHEGYGVVREFVSIEANYFNPGEGSHAALIIDGGGHIGLGTRDWNEHSNNAWSILGYDYVTLYPNGNGFVWVNSDLIIADRLALIPTVNFGSYNNDNQVVIHTDQEQRLTFYSEKPREIRIPEGGELDLSAFGFPGGSVDEGVTFPQQIEIAGRLRLIFEPGSTLRFPAEANFEPVLYINDEAEIIFEGVEDRDHQIPSSFADTQAFRSRILGVGQIWLNKKAEMKVFDTSFLGIETDDYTLTTSITISVQRQAALLIGDENVAGGILQVGNVSNMAGSSIDFNVLFKSPESSVVLRRGGFLGFGVGCYRKEGVINGSATKQSWAFQGLYNVTSITIDSSDTTFDSLDGGIFDHNQIFDGDDRNASLLAIGPAGTYYMQIGNGRQAVVKGGGNILYIAAAGDTWPATNGYSAEIIGDSPSMTGGTTGDYTIMACTPLIRQLSTVDAGTGTITKPTDFQRTFVGDAQGFYNYVKYPLLDPPPTGQIWSPYVCFGKTELELTIGYIANPGTGGTYVISREYTPGFFSEEDHEDSLGHGSAKAIFATENLGEANEIPRATFSGLSQSFH